MSRRVLLPICAIALIACLCPSGFAQESVPGEYVVVLRREAVSIAEINALDANAKQDQLRNLAERLFPERQAEVTQVVGLVNAVGVKVPENQVAPEGQPLAELLAAKSDEVLLVEPNFIYYQDQPGSPDPDIPNMWFLAPIQADAAWQVRDTSDGIVVAVIDTGVFLKHEDLDGHLWVNEDEQSGGNNEDDDDNGFDDDVHGYDFYNGDPDPSADFVTRVDGTQEFESHGTHVAGTIGAVGDNGKGIVGITRKVEIMPIKALGGPRGSGDSIDLIASIDYAVQNGATIINASWGGGGRSRAMEMAIDRANSAGVLFVAAAGNGGFDRVGDDNDQDPHFPSSYDSANIIAVAASGPNDQWARLSTQPSGISFSNFGAESVDLAAPGESIRSTIPRGSNASSPQSAYANFNGTSMATPIVSGTVALMRAEFPTMNHLAIRELLLKAIDPVPAFNGKLVTGGRLNMLKALRPIPPSPDAVPSEATTAAIADAATDASAADIAELTEMSTSQAIDNARTLFRPGLSPTEQASE